MADVFCFVLPWTDEADNWLRWYRIGPGRPRTIMVAWRRSPPVERALAYLDQHFAEDIKLSALAADVGSSKFHLVRLFKATLGITPHRCQLLLRLSRAKAMLRDGIDIAQVALDLGFFDQSHLDRTFRVLAGIAPSQYQKGSSDPSERNFLQDEGNGGA